MNNSNTKTGFTPRANRCMVFCCNKASRVIIPLRNKDKETMGKSKKHTATMQRLARGFTLIELLLYIAIISFILGGVSLLLAGLLEARVKQQTISEVEFQAGNAMREITQAIRNAEGINAPTSGTSNSLSLDAAGSANDPTVFAVSSGTLEITEGGGSATALTNDRITVSDITFENVSKTDTPGIIQVIFTVSHDNPEGQNAYEYTQTFTNSAALRQ